MMALWIVLVLVVVTAWDRLYLDRWSRNLSFEIHFSGGSVFAGEEAELYEVLENRKKLPLPALEAAFRIEKGVLFRDAENIIISDYNYKRDLFAMRGMEQVRRTYVLDCPKRGLYTVSQAVLTFHSALFHTKYQQDYGQDEQFYVYPARTDVQRILRSLDSILGTQESARRLYEDPFAFSSIREYTIRDPMKTINWKASARMGELMVNTFSSVRSEQFVIFLDIEDRRVIRQDEEVEKGISVAASLCDSLIRRGQDVGLYVNTDPVRIFFPTRGSAYLGEILRFLTTDFSAGGTTDFEEMVRTSETDPRRIMILISKELVREESPQLLKGAGASAQAVCIVPYGPGNPQGFDMWPLHGG